MAALVLRSWSRGVVRASHGGTTAYRTTEPLHRHTGFRQKSSVQFLSRPDLPKLAYQSIKGKSPGVIFLPGFASNMNGQKAVALEEFCKSLGHSYVRFDYTGCGASEGEAETCTIGKWKKDVLTVIDELTEGPQAKKEIEEKGVWKIPSKYNEEGFYSISYDFIKEAENHCVLHSPIPVTCPVRLIHGMKDDDVPWHVSIQVADRILSPDLDVTLRKHGQHRMSDKDDLKLLVYTVDDLIDKLTTN
ncbi:palmitoyl-protein thioesterase ABHD10, mitochondrial-like isoform X2 [Acipenser ruthenus]|uniref:palmitoyl-protein thioesterase ABHD10, mitochondrial-like isoform X2 n=1 Tax=Acipenser ruthenus TaxID=7906 RepID=UPI00155FB7E8|nr:palmitoyl-protein thioesterase ABHD10, mitochondrial-like isoform X2 [Acipenser ruthenus]